MFPAREEKRERKEKKNEEKNENGVESTGAYQDSPSDLSMKREP
jgi:hypothetical protein